LSFCAVLMGGAVYARH
jgi:hypothetical protein